MGNRGIATELGDTVAEGTLDGATPPVLTQALNVQSVARSAKGIFSVTLFSQIDPGCCNIMTSSSVDDTVVAVNPGGADTAQVKNFRVFTAGALADSGFSFVIQRARYNR